MSESKVAQSEYGLGETEHYKDYPEDPVFYHPELDVIKVWAQFNVLLPEKYGWVVIGEL